MRSAIILIFTKHELSCLVWPIDLDNYKYSSCFIINTTSSLSLDDELSNWKKPTSQFKDGLRLSVGSTSCSCSFLHHTRYSFRIWGSWIKFRGVKIHAVKQHFFNLNLNSVTNPNALFFKCLIVCDSNLFTSSVIDARYLNLLAKIVTLSENNLHI